MFPLVKLATIFSGDFIKQLFRPSFTIQQAFVFVQCTLLTIVILTTTIIINNLVDCADRLCNVSLSQQCNLQTGVLLIYLYCNFCVNFCVKANRSFSQKHCISDCPRVILGEFSTCTWTPFIYGLVHTNHRHSRSWLL